MAITFRKAEINFPGVQQCLQEAEQKQAEILCSVAAAYADSYDKYDDRGKKQELTNLAAKTTRQLGKLGITRTPLTIDPEGVQYARIPDRELLRQEFWALESNRDALPATFRCITLGTEPLENYRRPRLVLKFASLSSEKTLVKRKQKYVALPLEYFQYLRPANDN